ncbi:MAG: DUF2934 domain-containing protein [Acidobacteriota bacterium]
MSETGKKATTSKPRKAAVKKAVPKVESIRKNDSGPSHEQIAELARKFWAERGYKDGHEKEDWLRAEQELRAKAS